MRFLPCRRGDAADRAVATAAAAVAVDGFVNAPILGAVALDLGVTLAAATGVTATYLFAYGLAQPAWGCASPRLGRVRTLRAGLLLGALGAVASALAPSLVTLSAARAVSALGLASVIATAVAHLGEDPDEAVRAASLGRLLTGYACGVATGALTAGLLAQVGSWRTAYLLSAGVCLLAYTSTAALRRSTPTPGGTLAPRAAVQRVLRDGRARRVLALGALDGAVLVAALTLLAPTLAERGRPALWGGTALAAYAAAVVLISPLVPRLTRGLRGPAGLVRAGAAVAGTGLALAAADPDVAGVIAAAVAVGFAWATLHASLLGWISQLVPEARGAAVALFTTSVFCGSALSTRAAAGALDAGHAGAVFAVGAAGVGLLGLVGARLIGRITT